MPAPYRTKETAHVLIAQNNFLSSLIPIINLVLLSYSSLNLSFLSLSLMLLYFKIYKYLYHLSQCIWISYAISCIINFDEESKWHRDKLHEAQYTHHDYSSDKSIRGTHIATLYARYQRNTYQRCLLSETHVASAPMVSNPEVFRWLFVVFRWLFAFDLFSWTKSK